MGLFGKPRTIKKLDMEIMAARVALSMIDKLPPDHQQRVLATAPQEIAQAAKAAAVAGQGEAARTLLAGARAKAPSSSAADRWPEMIDVAIAAI